MQKCLRSLNEQGFLTRGGGGLGTWERSVPGDRQHVPRSSPWLQGAFQRPTAYLSRRGVESRLQGLLVRAGGTPVLERRHAYLISPLAHFELDLIEHPDTTNPAKSNIVSTLMHIHLGVIKNKNTAPWGLFKDRRESSDFPSVYSGVIK